MASKPTARAWGRLRRRAPSAEAEADDAGRVASAENMIELAALERLLERARGFGIAAAVVNHPTLRERLVTAVKTDLPDRRIAELTLTPSPESVLRAVERAGRDADALFVFGLETLGPLSDRAPGFAELNLNRDHLRQAVAIPVVLWAPDFAIRSFARQAADLWSGRSGLYRFEPEPGDPTASSSAGFDWSQTPAERREREALLRDLLEELDEGADERAARAAIVRSLGDAAGMQNRHGDALALYEQALPIYREIGDRLGEANTLHSLGQVARMQSRYGDALALYERALPIHRDVGDRRGEANTLHSLGQVARMQARHQDALALYERALPIHRKIGDRLGEATTLASLGDAALTQERHQDALALYERALSIQREVGSRLGEATTLASLGDVALMQARYGDALALYEQTLPIQREVGSRLGEANTLRSLGQVARMQGRHRDALVL